jgi:predicted PurR-regulated permease PerM
MESGEGNSEHRYQNEARAEFNRRLFLTMGAGVAVVTLLLLLWHTVEILMLIFAGILLAVLLRGFSDWVSRRTPLSEGWALAMVMIAILAVLTAGVWRLAPGVADQVDQLKQSLPQAVQQVEERIKRYEWGRAILAQWPGVEELVSGPADLISRATGVFSRTFSAVAYLFIILFVGLYLAVSPRTYVNGLLRLVPPSRRGRAGQVLEATGSALQWWLIGRVGTMIAVGVFTWVGLWALGVPLALTLGLLAALLDFIPNFGPILAAIPAILLALMQSPAQAFYVALLYLVVQQVESYLLTPLVQQHTVELPPALTIASQIMLGVLLGGIGLVLATPLTVVAFVLIRKLYIEDGLGDSLEDTNAGREPHGRRYDR